MKTTARLFALALVLVFLTGCWGQLAYMEVDDLKREIKEMKRVNTVDSLQDGTPIKDAAQSLKSKVRVEIRVVDKKTGKKYLVTVEDRVVVDLKEIEP